MNIQEFLSNGYIGFKKNNKSVQPSFPAILALTIWLTVQLYLNISSVDKLSCTGNTFYHTVHQCGADEYAMSLEIYPLINSFST